MALPKKKVTVLGEEVTITGLNCEQVEELMSIGEQVNNDDGKPTFSKVDAEKRAQFAVNTALGAKPANGSWGPGTFNDRWPKKDFLFTDHYTAFNELHREVLNLSGLETAKPGEGLAVVEKSTSDASAAA